MNVTNYVSEFTARLSQTPPSAYPGLVWTSYIRYLWNYESDSWVARIAYFCRIFALLLSLPTIILGLLDIASYGIARTLGVIDDVKASTSDKSTVHLVNAPTIHVEAYDSTPSEGATSDDALNEKPKEFFATDNNLKLSGVDVFSPAASRPSSPTLSRKALHVDKPPTVMEEEEYSLRHRTQQIQSDDP
ncbi:hypothetical protein FA15DRAFT_620166 [Coprinopsis marcescibilis]|uniref:Uncharacterized protein n=1 Tax=Coprinopsis marcescibilis TaxID=230819 RepID=A0A5C3KTV8_COPMA|nr:hypothetical protein FA15DRAFT_620166 [Coprinopsis marcescibilis]